MDVTVPSSLVLSLKISKTLPPSTIRRELENTTSLVLVLGGFFKIAR
jgi:hypothetical protein